MWSENSSQGLQSIPQFSIKSAKTYCPYDQVQCMPTVPMSFTNPRNRHIFKGDMKIAKFLREMGKSIKILLRKGRFRILFYLLHTTQPTCYLSAILLITWKALDTYTKCFPKLVSLCVHHGCAFKGVSAL